MTIHIPNEILTKSGLSEETLQLRIAIALFAEELFTLGQASQFAGLHQIQMQRELAKRNIPLHYGLEEYRNDMQTIARIA